MKVDPTHFEINVPEVEQENEVTIVVQSIQQKFVMPSTKDKKKPPVPESDGVKESSQHDKSKENFKEGDMFELDDEDYTILHQWKSHEVEIRGASEPNANQYDNNSEY